MAERHAAAGSSAPRRFAMAQGRLRPLLALLRGGGARAVVEVYPESVTFRFGFFVECIGRDEIAEVAPARWHWWRGVGWRLGRRCIGLISAQRNVVSLTLRETRRTMLLVPWRYQRIFVSLEDADGFVAALQPPAASA